MQTFPHRPVREGGLARRRVLLALPALSSAFLMGCGPRAATLTAGRSGASGAAGLSPEQRAAIVQQFQDFESPGSPGVAVAIVQGGQLVHAAAFGLADLEAGTRITPRTPFHVASLSKQFTAFAIALLAHEGKVDLEADIRRYLPEVPEFGPVIRVRHLIAHTSGLRNQWTLFAMGGQELGNRLRQRQILQLVARQRALDFPPGTEYAYSNTGYTLLAEIVHRASGESLRAFTTRRIFAPLGMKETFFFDDVTEVVPGRAQSYVKGKGEGAGWSKALLNFDNVGATSLFSTVEDLAHWAGNFRSAQVGGAALIRQVTTPFTLDDGRLLDYAYALQRTQLAGREVIMHSGSDAGFNALFVMYPDHDLAVVTTANTPMDLRAKTAAIADALLPSISGAAGTVVSAPLPPPQRPPAQPMPINRLPSFVGRYRSPELDHSYDVKVVDDELVLDSLWSAEAVTLRYVGGNSFTAPLWYAGRLNFEKSDGQYFQELSVDGGRARKVRFYRIVEPR